MLPSWARIASIIPGCGAIISLTITENNLLSYGQDNANWTQLVE
jgi:hypothetical protein